jgi:hypothetical protein
MGSIVARWSHPLMIKEVYELNTSNVITAVVVGGRATAMSKRYMPHLYF